MDIFSKVIAINSEALSKIYSYIFQFVLLFAIVALGTCVPQYKPEPAAYAKRNAQHAEILRYNFNNIGVDGFNYA